MAGIGRTGIEMDRRKKRSTLWIWIIAAILLRLTAMCVLHAWNRPQPMEHWFIARALYFYHSFAFGDFGYVGPTAVQSPIYPVILDGAYHLFGFDTTGAYAATMTLNALLGGLGVWLTYNLAQTMGAKPQSALLAAAMIAIWPSQIYTSTVTQAIALITVGYLGMIVLFYRAIENGRITTWTAFSVVACLTALTEPAVLPLAAFSGLLVLNWKSLEPYVRIRNAAILFLAACMIIAPWMVRNRIMLGKWLPVKGEFWANVWKGANDTSTGTDFLPLDSAARRQLFHQMFTLYGLWTGHLEDSPERHRDLLPAGKANLLWYRTEMQREDVFKKWSIDWIKEHPRQYALISLERLAKTVTIDWDNPNSYNLLCVVPRTILIIGSVMGLLLAWRKNWKLLYPCLLIGSCLLLYTLTLTAARFSVPLEPILFCFAAEAGIVLWKKIRRWEDEAWDLSQPVAEEVSGVVPGNSLGGMLRGGQG